MLPDVVGKIEKASTRPGGLPQPHCTPPLLSPALAPRRQNEWIDTKLTLKSDRVHEKSDSDFCF